MYGIFLFLFTLLAGGCGSGSSNNDNSGGSSESTTPTTSNSLSLTQSRSIPGEVITLKQPSIREGSNLAITFSDNNGYEVTAKTSLTNNGEALVSTPPYYDFQSGLVTSGNLTVTIPNTNETVTLFIEEPPVISDTIPGEILQLVLDASIDDHISALENISSLSSEEQTAMSSVRNNLASTLERLYLISEELEFQQITIEQPSGELVTISGEELLMIDRLLAAKLSGAVKSIQNRSINIVGSEGIFSVLSRGNTTRNEIARDLGSVKRSIAAMKLLVLAAV